MCRSNPPPQGHHFFLVSPVLLSQYISSDYGVAQENRWGNGAEQFKQVGKVE